MLWLICFFNYADRQTISVVLPKLHEEFGFDDVQQGLISSAFMWLYAGAAVFAGFIVDRCRRTDLIAGGCLFWSFVTLITGWCAKLWQFVAVRALEGLGETFYFPAGLSLLGDYHAAGTRSRALSFHQSGVYAGTILGSWLGAWLAQKYGWRAGFYFFGGAGMALALVLWRFLREPPRGAAEGADAAAQTGNLSFKETWRAIFKSPVVPLLMLAFVGANFVATLFLAWTPTFLMDKFGFQLASAGLSGTVFIHLASAVSVAAGGVLADGLARRRAGGRILVQAAGLLCGAPFVYLVGVAGDKTTLMLAMTAFGLCKGFYDSGIFASLYDSIEPRARGTAAGLMNTVGWAGGALGPLYVGFVTQYGHKPSRMENMSDAISYGGGVYLAAAGLLLAAILCLRKQASHPS